MDTAKSGKNTIGIWSILCLFTISTIFFLSLITPAYAEKKKVVGTYKLAKYLMGSVISEADKTSVQINSLLYVLGSTDPAWNNASFFSIDLTIDPSHQGDGYRSYVVITHSGGNQIFIESKGFWVTKIEGEFVKFFESEGFIQGGTGKFEGIKGLWKSKAKASSETNVIGEWEIVYFKSDF